MQEHALLTEKYPNFYSVLFIHIPLPEYYLMYNEEKIEGFRGE